MTGSTVYLDLVIFNEELHLCVKCNDGNSLHKRLNFFIKEFFSKCDQIRRKLRIWSHLLKNSSMENFIFCAVTRIRSNLEARFLQESLKDSLKNILKRSYHNLQQKVGGKFTKLSKIGFSMECPRADFMQFFTKIHAKI